VVDELVFRLWGVRPALSAISSVVEAEPLVVEEEVSQRQLLGQVEQPLLQHS